MKKTNKIPEYQISENVPDGIYITGSNLDNSKSHDVHLPHRDDHYLLIISFDGSLTAVVDFEKIKITKPFITLIVPGQVHQVLKSSAHKIYAISFNADLMPNSLKPLFENYFLSENILPYNKSLFENIESILKIIIAQKTSASNAMINQSNRLLLHSILTMIAANVEARQNPNIGSRSKEILQDFHLLLHTHFRKWKQPANYAEAMHISVSHLNDTIKELTGISVSTHIQRCTVTEAKRMLWHTTVSIQEIAYQLGYEDASYFARLFKKVAGITPSEFCSQFRD